MRLVFIALFSVASCSSEEPTTASDAATDAADSAAADTTNGCEPGCHYECFGPGIMCTSGTVSRQSIGDQACCHFSDFDANPCNVVKLFDCPSKQCAEDAGAVTPSTDANALCAPELDAATDG